MVTQTTLVVFSFNGHQNLLEYCLRSIATRMPPGYREVILVWDDNVDWYPIDFDAVRKKSQVDFRLVKQSSIADWPESIIRCGWIKQQLAKLYCWKYVDTEYTWIVDGDVLVTGDPQLFDEQRAILRYDNRKSVPDDYKFFAKKYLGIDEFKDNTFVGSTALWKNSFCRELEQRCINHSSLDLIQAVDNMLGDDHPNLPFSEFEYYGHHICSMPDTILKSANWNYVSTDQNWNLPIQIQWAQNDCKNLDQRYANLMQHRDPSLSQ